MNDIHSENNKKINYKLYTQRSITLATYIGGPVAAGWLIRENYRSLGKDDYGKHALFISIIATIFIFTAIFSIPEAVIDKIPNYLIPIVYTGIIYFIVEKIQGHDIAMHKENKGEFYSGWKAAGVGAINMVLILVVILGYTFYSPDSFDTDKYNEGIALFQKNEQEALTLFDLIEKNETEAAIQFIHKKGITLWNQNLALLQEMNQLQGLDQEYIDQNNLFIQYCQLRIKSFKLIEKALIENTDKYQPEIISIHQEINEILKMN